MTFKDLYTIALERVDEDTTGIDTITLDVVKNGVNEGYRIIAAMLDKKFIDYIVDFDKMIALPDDCAEVERIQHENLGYLSKMDYRTIEQNLYMNTIGIDSGEVTITYTKRPDRLVGDTDVVVLKDAFSTLPAIYGAYAYQMLKRKYSSAQLLLAEFNSYLPKQTQQQ